VLSTAGLTCVNESDGREATVEEEEEEKQQNPNNKENK
jgi:hypothetical protein